MRPTESALPKAPTFTLSPYSLFPSQTYPKG